MSIHEVVDFIVAPIIVLAIGWLGSTIISLKIAMEKRVTFGELSKSAKELHDKANNQGERIAVLEDWRKSQ